MIPSFIIIHKTRPHKVWLPDEEGEYFTVGATCLYVCAFCSSTAACARENTALYSEKPGFWLSKNFSFLFFYKKTKKGKSEQQQYEQRQQETTIFKNCFRQSNLKIWKQAILKILIFLCVCVCACTCMCVSNVQSAASYVVGPEV